MKYLIVIALFFTGCGTLSNPVKPLTDLFKRNPNATPEQIEAVGSAISNTGTALSYFVIGGCALVLVGIIMLAFSVSKHAGIIFIIGGASCAFLGYTIEEYAHYTLIASLAVGLTYGGYLVGNKNGYSLGFEKGKDWEQVVK